jgi:predicted phosphohydrolase
MNISKNLVKMDEIMALYAISDLHLSLGTDKPMDIFYGWENYTEKLKKNWNNLIKPEDVVVIAGDISWAMKLDDAKNDFKFIENLPGEKIILKGNHDFWWSTVKKINDFFKKNSFSTIKTLHNSALPYKNYCICGTKGCLINPTNKNEAIYKRELGRLITSLNIAQEKNLEPIVFFHYPPVNQSLLAEDFLNILLERKISKCYYGHIHGNKIAKKTIIGRYKGIDFKLISCDYLNFTPEFIIE